MKTSVSLWATVCASLLGSLLVYVVVASCGNSGGYRVDRGMPTADAATPTCSQWQVMIVDAKTASHITDPSKIYGVPFDVPAGWEPFGTWGIDVLVRRCSN